MTFSRDYCQLCFTCLFLLLASTTWGQRQGFTSTFGDLVKITNGFSFSPDEKTLYTSERTSIGKQGGRHIWKTHKEGGESRLSSSLFEYRIDGDNLLAKRKISFANDSLDYYPRLNYDGTKLFFVSRRPVPKLNAQDSSFSHIWLVERKGDAWNAPRYVEELNTIGSYSNYAHEMSDGSVVFISDKPGSKPAKNGKPSLDLWISEWKNGKFQESSNFEFFNTEHDEEQPFMDQAGRIFIFKRNFNDESHVYLSIRENEKWREPREIYVSDFGGYDEHCPFLSRDGKTFYFSYNLTIMHIPFAKLLTQEELAILK